MTDVERISLSKQRMIISHLNFSWRLLLLFFEFLKHVINLIRYVLIQKLTSKRNEFLFKEWISLVTF